MNRGRWFVEGERVVMTRRALRMGLQGRASSPKGRVVRVRSHLGITVLRDGLKHPDTWFSGFWRREKSWA